MVFDASNSTYVGVDGEGQGAVEEEEEEEEQDDEELPIVASESSAMDGTMGFWRMATVA